MMRQYWMVAGLLGVLAGGAFGTGTAGERAAGLKGEAAKLMFTLVYVGPVDRSFESGVWGRKPSPIECAIMAREVITPETARGGVVGWMEGAGLLAEGALSDPATPLPAAEERYVLSVSGGSEVYRVDLGWDLRTAERIEGMATALGAGGGERMKGLLAKLNDVRAGWTKEAEGRAIAAARVAIDAHGGWADRAEWQVRRTEEGWNVFATRVDRDGQGKPIYVFGGHAMVMLDGAYRVTGYVPGR